MAEHLAVHSGAQVSHYILKEPLGQGNLTQTWRAVDHRDGSEVALRIFSNWLSHAPETRDRLEQEVATLQLITHPALVPIACAEFHEGERPSFLATPFIAGASLMRRLAAAGTFTAADALTLLEPVIDVVAVLHSRGVVHDNIRPSNIVIDTTGKAHLTDSDLSRVVDMPGPPLAGTYEYMSPERLAGGKTIPASDIYSLGCVLYEMLAGVPPFTGTADQVKSQQQTSEPKPLPSRTPAIPEAVASAVLRCLERDPAKRFASGEELQSALGLSSALQLSTVFVGHQTGKRPVAPLRSDSKKPLWATFSAVIAGLAFAGWAGYTFAPSHSEKARAMQIEHFKQMDWNNVSSSEMPVDCLGYQPCVNRREALERH